MKNFDLPYDSTVVKLLISHGCIYDEKKSGKFGNEFLVKTEIHGVCGTTEECY